MTGPKDFLFVDSYSSSADARSKELARAQALSHAARVSHPRNRQGHSKSTNNQQRAGKICEPEERAETLQTDESPSNEEESKLQQGRNPRKKSYNVQRWRIVQKKHSGSNLYGGPQAVKQPGKSSFTRADKIHDITLPMHRGNSDPFNCTSVPFTALDLALIRDDRTSLVDIVWPAEIAIRRNQSSLVDEVWKVMPSILDVPAVAHAIISHSHYSRAVRYQVLGQRNQNAMALAEKHKMRAVRGLRDLLEEYQQSARLDLLKQVRSTSAQLAACGVISGDAASAQIHFTGVRMATEIMGGLKNMSQLQSESLVFSQVASAWFNRTRPVFHSDEWDPGPWSEYKLTVSELLSSTSDNESSSVPLLYTYDGTEPSTISPGMRAIIDEIREMLYVEEIKLALASSTDEMATQVFRWSGLRKLAIRARNLCRWCDLKDAIAQSAAGTDQLQNSKTSANSASSAAFDLIICLAVRCFDRAIFEEHYYLGQSSFRFSKMFLAEVAANLQRLSPAFPSHDDALDESRNESRVLEDERRFDMLWMYSIGAYVEYCHIPTESRRSSTASEPMVAAQGQGRQDVSSTSGSSEPFSTRFSKLVKTLGFERFEDVTVFLSQRYLYCARLQDRSLRRLVDF